ncbi:LysR family transcriptional regulator [Pollutimonas subterranea]|uniref:LysR family transcriptional regulator n=1 Tax=Pollutimonas subterranea TaxID=2045210 RepID=A0A2N4U245_9BURK|nr:LysR substrate-binding domain-containing protein [Pollutimonas subterranea]PLC49089.1 LysR family transcriptional regulator [Pollutimonas subterranea]
MKQHHLKALLAAAQTGTIRAAARQLNLSQAALTKSLKELEGEVGAELLIRSYRGVQLTAAGKILHDRAKVARQQLDIAQSEIHALTGQGQIKLSVGVTPMVVLSVLPDVWAHFRRLRPLVALNLREGLPSIVAPALVEGEMDFAVIMAEPALVPEALSFEPLVRTAFYVVGRKGHPMAGTGDVQSLMDYEWILSMHAGSYSERVVNWMISRGLAPPRRILDTNSTLINWQLVSSTDMLTVLPAVFFEDPSIGAQTAGLVRFDVDLPDAVLGILRLKHAPPSTAAATLADLFRHYLRQQQSGGGAALGDIKPL